jgi:hypothetical protein
LVTSIFEGSPMGFRFRYSFKLMPGIKLNLGKSGLSASLGTRGAWFTLGAKGARATVGLPGTGMSYTSYTPFKKRKSASPYKKRTFAPYENVPLIQAPPPQEIQPAIEQGDHGQQQQTQELGSTADDSSWWPGLKTVALWFMIGMFLTALMVGR